MNRAALLERLRAIDLDLAYYAICHAHVATTPGLRFDKNDWHEALAAHGLGFRYVGQKCFRCAIHTPSGELEMRLAHTHGTVEASSLTVGGLGGTMHGLALEVAQLRDGLCARKPPYPRPDYRNKEDLFRVVSAYVALFQRLRTSLG